MDPRLNEEFLNIFEGDDETFLDADEIVKSAVSMVEHEVEEAMKQVADIWSQLGLPARRRDKRTEEISELIRDNLKDVVTVEGEALKNMILYKDTRFKQINEILSDLHMPRFEMPTSNCLFALGTLLHVKFEELKKVKDERMEQLISLKEKRDEISGRLGEQPNEMRMKTNIPSEEELVELRSYVSKLASELKKRQEKFATVKHAIQDLVIELEYDASNSFEREVLQNDHEFVLSKPNLNKLIEFHQKLERESKKNKEEKEAMIARLNYLWEKLSVDENTRFDILSSYTLNGKPTLKAIQEEQVEKYEVMRKERLGEFIGAIEPEVMQWWERCFVSEEEQIALTETFHALPLNSEEQLEAWEGELKTREKYYAERHETFEHIRSWSTCWEELIKIENNEKDPDRFKNRRIPSTQIMKEQQMKRKHENSIKKFEKELIALSKNLEIQGTPFLVDGMMLDTFIMARRQDYDDAKENEKQMKKMEKQVKLAAEMMGHRNIPKGGIVMRKTPVKRAGGNIGSASGTPMSPSKLRRVNEQQPASGSNVKRTGGTMSKPSTITKAPRGCTASKLPLRAVGQMTPSSGPSGSQQSLLSVNEEEFQAVLKSAPATANSTFSLKKSPMKKSKTNTQVLAADDLAKEFIDRNVTTRRAQTKVTNFGHGLRRKSRSCVDLRRQLNELQINGRGLVSTPASPMSASRRQNSFKRVDSRRPFRC